jgi:hypothetical protein
MLCSSEFKSFSIWAWFEDLLGLFKKITAGNLGTRFEPWWRFFHQEFKPSPTFIPSNKIRKNYWLKKPGGFPEYFTKSQRCRPGLNFQLKSFITRDSNQNINWKFSENTRLKPNNLILKINIFSSKFQKIPKSYSTLSETQTQDVKILDF